MLLFHLSGENLDLAREEILSLTKFRKYHQIRNVLIVESEYSKIFERLAFTHGVFRVLFACDADNFIEKIDLFGFQRFYRENFRVKILNLTNKKIGFDEEQIGGLVYGKLKNPKVELSNPKTRFFFIFADNKIACCELIKKIEKSFLERKPHLKPELHPTSLSPKLAKALINLTGVGGGVLLDPFCGSGGILVEAGLIGLRTVGFDIDKLMLRRAKINLEYYKIKNYMLELRDAIKSSKKYDYIVSELPFGRNSRVSMKNLELLYFNFLKTLDKILVKKAVLVFPDFLDYKKLINYTKLKIEKEFDYYIHKSMTKKILALTR